MITVFWASWLPEWQRATEPQSVAKDFYGSKWQRTDNPLMDMNHCPFFNSYLTNLYALRSVYDYAFRIEGDAIRADMHDQSFFDDRVTIRSIKQKCFSFSNRFLFFVENDSLVMQTNQFPVFEDNNVTRRCKHISGEMDIGKWFRPTEFPFFLRDDYDDFVIKQNEVYAYVRFCTPKRIKFQQFYVSQRIHEFMDSNLCTNRYSLNRLKRPEAFYDLFKTKKLIMKEIRQNLVS